MSQLDAGGASVAALGRLTAVIESLGPVVVAFSGGADSALLAKVATDVLGTDLVLCATAVSPSLPDAEVEACADLARRWGLRWQAVVTDEMARPAYVENGPDRCYHCKAELLDVLVGLAPALDVGATVVLGVNLDDLDDHRPGQRAAAERGARFPLVEAGLTKVEIRAVSRDLGLDTWDKPAAACLASRIPHGTPVTLGALASVQRAEAALHALGLRQVRVRHHGDVARIEVESGEADALWGLRAAASAAVARAGYRYVAVDLDGYRQGSMNPPTTIGAPPCCA